MMKQTGNERGGTLLLYTVAMVGMMGMAALAIDLGFLRKARAEAQRAADAAALAGASAFQLDLAESVEVDSARTRAYRVANANYMNGVAFDSLSEVTVTILPAEVKVRVKVRRAAVPTWFARVFGISSFPVGAIAAAEASYASGASCVKPLAVPDFWEDGVDDLNADHYPNGTEQWLWEPGDGDFYHPAHYDSDGDGEPNDGLGTGLGSVWRNADRDWGYQIVLQTSVNGGSQACPGSLQGNKCYVPGWWGWWGGAPKTREDMIKGCTGEADLGVSIDVESGWTNTLRQAVDDVVAMDAGASWNPTLPDIVHPDKTGTVVGSSYEENWLSSPRVWTVAMVAPADVPPDPADKTTVFNNFMSFFVEGCIDTDDPNAGFVDCSQGGPNKAIVGRFVGSAKGTKFGPAPGTMTRILRLVE